MVKAFKSPRIKQKDILSRESVDEMIYRSKKITAEYIRGCQRDPESRIFPICYSSALSMVRKLGEKIGIQIRPHDLRRYSATYASRNGIPLEVVSKVLLRHQDIKTTQMYLGKITDTEAIKWMDVLHG